MSWEFPKTLEVVRRYTGSWRRAWEPAQIVWWLCKCQESETRSRGHSSISVTDAKVGTCGTPFTSIRKYCSYSVTEYSAECPSYCTCYLLSSSINHQIPKRTGLTSCSHSHSHGGNRTLNHRQSPTTVRLRFKPLVTHTHNLESGLDNFTSQDGYVFVLIYLIQFLISLHMQFVTPLLHLPRTPKKVRCRMT